MQVAAKIDHTLLKAAAPLAAYEQLCAEARTLAFKTVCVLPYYVPYCVKALKGSAVGVTTVVGFPFGANQTVVKVQEAEQAFLDGAAEIDLVLNLGALKAGNFEEVLFDLEQVVQVARSFQKKIVKVILETALLTLDEKKQATQLVLAAGADFVKTSTGFAAQGALVADVELLVALVGEKAQVKAAGGIRTWAQASEFLKAGATRLGTSKGCDILEQYLGENEKKLE